MSEPKTLNKRYSSRLLMILLGAWIVFGPGFGHAGNIKDKTGDAKATAMPGAADHRVLGGLDNADAWGIRILHLYLSADNHLLDLRFRVTDRDKAATIMSRKHTAYLVDQKTNKTLPVPITKSGAMRQTTLKPEDGREYFMFFANPGGLIKAEALMTLAIGDIRIRNIRVEPYAAPLDAEAQKTLQQNKVTAWRAVRKELRQEYQQCRTTCREDEGCLEQCSRRMADREKSEYLRLVYGKERKPASL